MKDDHGYVAEDKVEDQCRAIFGSDFVLRSPQLIERKGARELTDIMVLVDDTMIVIQSKSLQLDPSDLDSVKFGRIVNKQKDAKQQLNTALNAHNNGSSVRVISPLNLEFTLDWSSVRRKIGIITLNMPDSLYKDPESRFQYPSCVEEYKGIIVHTFILNDFAEMAAELSTPGDFLTYLDVRERCMKSGNFIIGNELDFLALYKINYPEFEKALADPMYHLCLTPGIWEGYRSGHQHRIQARDSALVNSGIIDNLIRQLRSAVEQTMQEANVSLSESVREYLTLIGKLGKLRRLERQWIADAVARKLQKMKTSKIGYFIYISKVADIAYLFLFLNESRDCRKIALKRLSIQACHKVETSFLVGIASGGIGSHDRCTSALVMNVKEVRSKITSDVPFQCFGNVVNEKFDEWALVKPGP